MKSAKIYTSSLVGKSVKGQKVKNTLSGSGARRKPARGIPQTSAGYAFVVRAGECEESAPWFYVTFDYGGTLSTSTLPHRVFPEITAKMHEFWKQVVLNDTFHWEDFNVWPKTMKLVEVRHEVSDCAVDLFLDQETFENSRKLAALSKLTDEEAKLLDVGHEYFFLKINQDKPKSGAAERLADELRSQMEHLTVSVTSRR